MIRLPFTGTYSLELITAQNGAQVVVCYSDKTATGYDGGVQTSTISSATTTKICDTPASGAVRDVDQINIKNTYAGSHTVTVQVDANGTNYPLIVVVLLADESLNYTHGSGWQSKDANGNTKVSGMGDMLLGTAQTVTAAKSFEDGTMILKGATSGTTTLKAAATAGTTTVTLPAKTGTAVIGEAITDSGLTMATGKLLGRSTAATGAVEEISFGQIPATATNDAAAAGKVGEYVEAIILGSAPVDAPATGVIGDFAYVDLTAGDWDLTLFVECAWITGTTTTVEGGGVGVTSGNTYDILLQFPPPTSSYNTNSCLPCVPYKVPNGTTQRVYGKMLSYYTAGTPKFFGRMTARRVR